MPELGEQALGMIRSEAEKVEAKTARLRALRLGQKINA
jgi:hypothetical protein